MATDTILSCEHLVKLYDTATGRAQAVRGVDLDVGAGVTTAIVGPSGSGKSSLLRMIAGLDRPTAGHVFLDGIDLWAVSERRRAHLRAQLLTHVYQRPGENLYGHLTARMHLERAARGGDQSGTVDYWLDALRLTHRADHVPVGLSGGEQQRLAFGRAAAAGHRLVIADEPTSQLDSESAALVLDAIGVMADQGITVVLATHDTRALRRVSEVLTLRDGAVATVTAHGSELAAIDRSGRLQLPPEVLEHYPDRRAKLTWDATDGRVELERP